MGWERVWEEQSTFSTNLFQKLKVYLPDTILELSHAFRTHVIINDIFFLPRIINDIFILPRIPKKHMFMILILRAYCVHPPEDASLEDISSVIYKTLAFFYTNICISYSYYYM